MTMICFSIVAATSTLAQSDPAAVEQAMQPLRHYYAAINQRNYAEAFAVWEKREDGKAANGQSFTAFKNGFRDTAQVKLEIGNPGEIEGAAGLNFIEIPVVILATSKSGQQQKFAGIYTMRSSNMADDHNWHIYSAKVKKVK
jgi:hypothetical protein